MTAFSLVETPFFHNTSSFLMGVYLLYIPIGAVIPWWDYRQEDALRTQAQ